MQFYFLYFGELVKNNVQMQPPYYQIKDDKLRKHLKRLFWESDLTGGVSQKSFPVNNFLQIATIFSQTLKFDVFFIGISIVPHVSK